MKRKYDIKWFDVLDSTNNELTAHMERYDDLTVVAARNQTAGRGQRGNTWKAEPGANLTFSLLLRFGQVTAPMEAREQAAITQAATLALTSLLEGHGIQADIKWPNDIYVHDRKICGMLIENSVSGTMLRTSVVGIGLNVNQRNFPEDLPNPTSMVLESEGRFDTQVLLEEYTAAFDVWSRAMETPVGRQELREAYLKRLYRKDELHTFLDMRDGGRIAERGTAFEGTIRGISEKGLLLVEREGLMEEWGFKEIAYVL